MSTHNRRSRRTQPNTSDAAGTALKLLFITSFIAYAVLLYIDGPLSAVLGIFGITIIVSFLYVFFNKSEVAASKSVHTNIRIIIANLLMVITMFFYGLALWRSDQFTPAMQVTLFIGGPIIYGAVYNSTKSVLKK